MAMAKMDTNSELTSKVVNSHRETTPHPRQAKKSARGAKSTMPMAPRSTPTMAIQQYPTPHLPLMTKHWQDSILGHYWQHSVTMTEIALANRMTLMTPL